MNQPSLYANNNDLQQKNAKYVLKKYAALIRWKTNEEENVLDVGCGDGTVTANILYPFLPKNVRKLVAVDMLLEMIEYAKARHTRKNLVFEQLDISTKKLGTELKEEFHHIFSFFCLHWVQDQRQCVSNLYDILRPGGDIFLLFVVTSTVEQVYENLSKHKIWGRYLNTFRDYISPYYFSKDPANEYRFLLSQVGFDVDLCEIIERCYTFKDVTSWQKFAMAINPFLGKIPDDLKDDFFNAMLSETMKLNGTVLNEGGGDKETIEIRIKLFMVHANKVSKITFRNF